jgi:hypothetical protein
MTHIVSDLAFATAGMYPDLLWPLIDHVNSRDATEEPSPGRRGGEAELEPDVSFARGVGGPARRCRNSEGLGRRPIGWDRHSARFAATPSFRWRLRDLATAAIVEKGPKLLTPVGPGFDRIARAASCHALVASAPRTRDEAD